MNRVLSIVVLIVALVGLCTPSLSQGMGVSGAVWSSNVSQASALTTTRAFSCKSLGGKRVLPCHPDQGVMTGMAAANVPSDKAALSRRIALPESIGGPEAELPPPRWR